MASLNEEAEPVDSMIGIAGNALNAADSVTFFTRSGSSPPEPFQSAGTSPPRSRAALLTRAHQVIQLQHAPNATSDSPLQAALRRIVRELRHRRPAPRRWTVVFMVDRTHGVEVRELGDDNEAIRIMRSVAPLIRSCPRCRELLVRNGNRAYCSAKCASAARNERRKRPGPEPQQPVEIALSTWRACAYARCGRPFQQTRRRGDRRFCSAICGARHRAANQRRRRRAERTSARQALSTGGLSGSPVSAKAIRNGHHVLSQEDPVDAAVRRVGVGALANPYFLWREVRTNATAN